MQTSIYFPNRLGVGRPGVGLSFDDVFAWIGNAAGQGSNTTGEISDALLRSGMTIEAVRQALQTVAANVTADPQRVAVIQDELRYINTGGAVGVGAQSSGNSWAVPALVAVLIYLAVKKD